MVENVSAFMEIRSKKKMNVYHCIIRNMKVHACQEQIKTGPGRCGEGGGVGVANIGMYWPTGYGFSM